MSSEQQIRLALIIGLLISSNIMLWFKVYKLEEKTNWPITANLQLNQLHTQAIIAVVTTVI